MPDTPMTAARLEEIRARAEAATDGPWTVECERDCSLDDELPTDIWRGIMGPNGPLNVGEDIELFSEADADFIAHARTDIPDLLAEINELHEIGDKLRARCMTTFVEVVELRGEIKRLNALVADLTRTPNP